MIIVNEKEYEADQFHTVEEVFRKVFGTPRHPYLASLNGTFILRTKWDDTSVTDGDVLVFIPISSGG